MKTKRIPGPGQKALVNTLKELKTDKVGKVGWGKSAQYEDGTQVAYVAMVQEYGDPTHHIPPRPFMRSTISEKQQEWKEILNKGAKAILKGSHTVNQVLEAVTLKAAGDVRQKIATIQEPPLKDSTIAARLNRRSDKTHVGNLTKPLVDTATMINTLTGVVE